VGKCGLIRNPILIPGKREISPREPRDAAKAPRGPVHSPRVMLAGAVIVIMVIFLVVAGLLVRHYSSPEYLEKRLSAATGSKYLIDIGSSHYDPLRRSLDATDVSLESDPSRPAPKDRPRTRLSLRAGAVHVSGLNLRALQQGNIDIERILVDSPKASIYVDRFGVPLDHPRPPIQLPNQAIAKSGKRIRIETVNVLNGDIHYSERSRGGARPGVFRFADLNATIDHLTNDATQSEHPCVIDVRTLLANSGPLKATFEYDLSSPDLRMKYHATIGKMDATSLNELLVNLKGIRITEGTIDATTLSVRMGGDVATGTMTLLYHGLKFEILDKGTHEQDVGDHVATWMQNWQTHSSNPTDRDDPPTVITIQRRREPYISLIKFVWETVRDGVLQSVGVQSP
jgi:hypothetical protein